MLSNSGDTSTLLTLLLRPCSYVLLEVLSKLKDITPHRIPLLLMYTFLESKAV